MSGAAVSLIAASVALHVAWNAISKATRPTPAFFLLASLVSSAALSPVLFWQRDSAVEALGTVLPVLVPTGLFAAVYNVALARAYQSGDLSLVYPLARSLGPVGVALVSVALGRAERIGAGCAVGIAMITLGSVALPLRHFDSFRLAQYRTRPFLFAVATAAATVGYTLLDDQALRWLRAAPALQLDTLERSLLYAAMQAWATTVALAAYVACSRRERAEASTAFQTQRREAVAVGIFGYAAYILILAAMSFARDVTYVAAFRQLGIPLAIFVGMAVLREPMSAPRVVGGALCTAGLLLVAIG